jgi:hypothetical protein
MARALREALPLEAALSAHREECQIRGCPECARLDGLVVAVWDAWRAVPPWSRQVALF